MTLRPPSFQAGRLENGSVQMAWDTDVHHLDVDLKSDGTFEWFYRNRLTEELDGTEDGQAFDPIAFIRAVKKLHGTE